MTEYIFKYDKLLPLPELNEPHYLRILCNCPSCDKINKEWDVFDAWKKSGIDPGEELKLEEDKVYNVREYAYGSGVSEEEAKASPRYYDRKYYKEEWPTHIWEKLNHKYFEAIPVSTAQKEDSVIEKYLKRRIKELNDADAAFCADRWLDDGIPLASSLKKQIAREQSNKVTFARQELESILSILTAHQNKEGENYMGDEDFKNSIATQIRFHTISGKSFEDTVESIFKNAVKWAKYPDEGENDVPGASADEAASVASHTSTETNK